MTSTSDKATSKKNIKYPLMIVAGAAVLCAGGASFYFRTSETPVFVRISDLPKGAGVETYLQTKTATDILPNREGVIDLPESLKNISAPYRITSSVKMVDDSYRDFTITVTTNDNISVIADGFHAGDKVSLTLDGHNIFRDMPADWSGKIELNASLPPNKVANTCLEVIGKTETLGICHARPEGRAS